MLPRLRAHLPVLIACLLALLAGGGLAVVVTDGDPSTQDHTLTVVDVALGKNAQGKTVRGKVNPAVVDVAERTEVGDHQGARDEAPFAASPLAQMQVGAARQQQDRIAKTQRPLPTAGASRGFAGCRTSFVRNQSSRGGVRPQQHWYHYTVSPNRPGWSDVNAIVSLFNQPSFQASSHFVIDAEGNCAYIVPIEAKAWTQAAANPIAVSYEIINSGSEGRLMDPAGYAKLRSVTRQVSARTGIPLRRGAVNGCTSARSGIVQHKDGGICAGGHVDITPYSIEATVRLVAAGGASSPLTKRERRIVQRIARHHRRGEQRFENFWCQQSRQQRQTVRRTGFTTPKGRKLNRGTRYQRLQRNHRRYCLR